jgi:rhodanese-related sulfurtransferase
MIKISRALFAVFAVSAVLVFGGCGASSAASPTPAPTVAGPVAMPAEVSVTDAAALRDGGALMLDVREPDEWAAGHIPGATLIPLGQLASRLSEVSREATIVTVCRSGRRAAEARDILLGAGYQAVASMSGGMNEWVAAGLPVVTGP